MAVSSLTKKFKLAELELQWIINHGDGIPEDAPKVPQKNRTVRELAKKRGLSN